MRELAGDHGRARLVVVASEVGGRWSEESRGFFEAIGQDQDQECTACHPITFEVGVVVQMGHDVGLWRPSLSWSAEEVWGWTAPLLLLTMLSGRPGISSWHWCCCCRAQFFLFLIEVHCFQSSVSKKKKTRKSVFATSH